MRGFASPTLIPRPECDNFRARVVVKDVPTRCAFADHALPTDFGHMTITIEYCTV
jgi:hypothetical protein